jgi:hypothetical protein
MAALSQDHHKSAAVAALDDRSDIAARSLFHEVWTCGECGRHFPDATSCCAHEAQCGELTRC